MANLGPSEKLLARYRARKLTRAEFTREYRRELQMDGPVDARCKNIKNHRQRFTLRLLQRLASRQNVTIMCHCDEDQDQCHRHILKKMIATA